MHRPFLIVAVLGAVAAGFAGTPAGAATRSCGTVTAGHQKVSVMISRGPVTCTRSRAAAKTYISGRGTFHGPANGPRADQYVTLPGGWRCSVIEQGSVTCVSAGSNLSNARNVIGWTIA